MGEVCVGGELFDYQTPKNVMASAELEGTVDFEKVFVSQPLGLNVRRPDSIGPPKPEN
jgi:hypothetical protein